MSPLEGVARLFDEADARRADAPALFVLEEVLDPELLGDDADFEPFAREVEPDALDDVDFAFEPALTGFDAIVLPADFDFIDADFEVPDDFAVVLFFTAVDLVEEDFGLEVEDFDPPAFDAADFEELDLEFDAFLVVAMIFLRVIE